MSMHVYIHCVFYISEGTHDVQNVKAVYSNPGQIDVSASYLSGSTARGFFTIVYSPMNHSDVTYHVAIRDGMEPTTNLSIDNLQHSMSTLVVYDLMENTPGMPEVKPAATPQRVNMDGQLNNGMCKVSFVSITSDFVKALVTLVMVKLLSFALRPAS